jgi:hypothetical protein
MLLLSWYTLHYDLHWQSPLLLVYRKKLKYDSYDCVLSREKQAIAKNTLFLQRASHYTRKRIDENEFVFVDWSLNYRCHTFITACRSIFSKLSQGVK